MAEPAAGGTPAASDTPPAPLALVDAAGAPVDYAADSNPLDGNTLIVAAATWCGATQRFVASLAQPEIAAQLAGLRIIFAFENEGGDGPGGTLNPEFLADLPGDVAFLASGNEAPPASRNSASGAWAKTWRPKPRAARADCGT